MTETRKWTLGTVAVVVVLIAAIWFLLVSPKRTEAADLQAATQTQQDANAQLLTQIAVLKQQSKNLPEMQAKLAGLNTQIPADPALPSLIQELSAAAKSSGVDLESVTPARPAALVPDPSAPVATTVVSVNQIALQMTAVGGYFELQQFFNQLETLDRALLVTNAVIAESDQTTTASTAPKVTKPESPLTATITAQVFVAPPATTSTSTPSTTSGATTTTPTTAQ